MTWLNSNCSLKKFSSVARRKKKWKNVLSKETTNDQISGSVHHHGEKEKTPMSMDRQQHKTQRQPDSQSDTTRQRRRKNRFSSILYCWRDSNIISRLSEHRHRKDEGGKMEGTSISSRNVTVLHFIRYKRGNIYFVTITGYESNSRDLEDFRKTRDEGEGGSEERWGKNADERRPKAVTIVVVMTGVD